MKKYRANQDSICKGILKNINGYYKSRFSILTGKYYVENINNETIAIITSDDRIKGFCLKEY